MKLICKNCKSPNPMENDFCHNCGNSLYPDHQIIYTDNTALIKEPSTCLHFIPTDRGCSSMVEFDIYDCQSCPYYERRILSNGK